nr:helix-turn-helix domain-containing protein [uncultured Eudoraea sp.]
MEEAIRIDQLCRNAHVSERTLDYVFKEKYQVSPIEYIKAIKLNEVKKELLQSKEQLISSVAAKYGFWHMWQFAADFRKRFGELPSEVQKRRA